MKRVIQAAFVIQFGVFLFLMFSNHAGLAFAAFVGLVALGLAASTPEDAS